MQKGKRPRIVNTVLKKNKVGGLSVPDFKISNKTIGMKMAYWQKAGCIDQ